MADDRACRAGMAATIFQAPDFLAGQRVVRVESLRALAQQSRLPIQCKDLAGGKSLAQVPFGLGLAVRVEILVIKGPIFLPDAAPGFRIKLRR